MLPFIAGFWGTASLYQGFAQLCDTMPADRMARRAVLSAAASTVLVGVLLSDHAGDDLFAVGSLFAGVVAILETLHAKAQSAMGKHLNHEGHKRRVRIPQIISLIFVCFVVIYGSHSVSCRVNKFHYVKLMWSVAMGLLKRMSGLVTANLNDLIDQCEDPEKMLQASGAGYGDRVGTTHGRGGTSNRASQAAGAATERTARSDCTLPRSGRGGRRPGDDEAARHELLRKAEHQRLADALSRAGRDSRCAGPAVAAAGDGDADQAGRGTAETRGYHGPQSGGRSSAEVCRALARRGMYRPGVVNV